MLVQVGRHRGEGYGAVLDAGAFEHVRDLLHHPLPPEHTRAGERRVEQAPHIALGEGGDPREKRVESSGGLEASDHRAHGGAG